MYQVTISILLIILLGIPVGSWAQETDTSPLVRQLVDAALERTEHQVTYDGSYRSIPYPGGDVPDSLGVCTDVVIRSYRGVGLDLQVLVHEDMTAAFEEYPRIWGLGSPDPNIDHRRVPNLRVFFTRQGAEIPVSRDPGDYRPGDLVTWVIPGNLPHIGIVTDQRTRNGRRPLIVHNIGAGPVIEDVLLAYEITGHYRYPEESRAHRSLLVDSSSAPASVPGFLAELFAEVQDEYASFREEEFSRFCSAHGVDSADTTNRHDFFRLWFLHDLFTTDGAFDCARGGFLRIPYFWHWVEPNPRHSIFSLPDSISLTSRNPASPYQRYASVADIDRVPALYLGDLVAEEPGYFHPDCGSFFTFGWCSEREMAYTALMTTWGYPAKIWQSGIHTYSVVWCEFKRTSGTTVNLAAEVDNTFDSVTWREIPEGIEADRWIDETGSGAQIDWYNQKARSREQIDALRAIPVGDGTRERFRRLIRKGISGEH